MEKIFIFFYRTIRVVLLLDRFPLTLSRCWLFPILLLQRKTRRARLNQEHPFRIVLNEGVRLYPLVLNRKTKDFILPSAGFPFDSNDSPYTAHCFFGSHTMTCCGKRSLFSTDCETVSVTPHLYQCGVLEKSASCGSSVFQEILHLALSGSIVPFLNRVRSRTLPLS